MVAVIEAPDSALTITVSPASVAVTTEVVNSALAAALSQELVLVVLEWAIINWVVIGQASTVVVTVDIDREPFGPAFAAKSSVATDRARATIVVLESELAVT